MRDGAVVQRGTPDELYERPADLYVASKIGSPAINLVEAQLAQTNGSLSISFGEHTLPVDDRAARNKSRLKDYVGKEIILGIRPEDFEDASVESDVPADRRIKVTCDLTEPLGAEVLVYFSSEATGVVSSAVEAEAREDADVRLGGDEDDANKTRLCARVNPRSHIAAGQPAELTVDTSRLYFFDPQTRETL
jgi:multiple sugar transport system ATP-binding protein